MRTLRPLNWRLIDDGNVGVSESYFRDILIVVPLQNASMGLCWHRGLMNKHADLAALPNIEPSCTRRTARVQNCIAQYHRQRDRVNASE
jgi:hypothetical protein